MENTLLALQRPICFFDLETTGVHVAKDRILEIAILKIFPNGNKESKTWLVNPEMKIPKEVIAVHGITDEKVANEPTFNMKNRRSVDVQTIFHKMEKRTLSAAYKFYCDKELVNAHAAAADTLATYEVLLAQIEKYPELENNISALSEFSTRKKSLDFAGFIIEDKNGEAIFSFGKHKFKKVAQVLEDEPGYYSWIMQADFPLYTKKVLTQIRVSGFNNAI